MNNERTPTISAQTQTATSMDGGFRCPNCAMASTCSDCESFDWTTGYCEHHRVYVSSNSWCCPAFYNR